MYGIYYLKVPNTDCEFYLCAYWKVIYSFIDPPTGLKSKKLLNYIVIHLRRIDLWNKVLSTYYSGVWTGRKSEG